MSAPSLSSEAATENVASLDNEGASKPDIHPPIHTAPPISFTNTTAAIGAIVESEVPSSGWNSKRFAEKPVALTSFASSSAPGGALVHNDMKSPSTRATASHDVKAF